MKLKLYFKLSIISLIGNIIIALGVSTCRLSQMGIDPFTSMNTGVSSYFNISLGIYQACFNLILFLILVLLNKKNFKYLNVGAIINMFMMGFMVEHINNIYCLLFSVSNIDSIQLSIQLKLVILVIGVLLLTLGVSIYTTSDLGTGCYDALSIYMAEVFPIEYQYCRIITDTVCVLISILFTGPLGVATIILMFFTGPLINFWNIHMSKPIIKRFQN